MKSGWLGLAIERWGTFRLVLSYQQPDGTPVDLTGCSARLRIWRQTGDQSPLLDLDGVLDEPAGIIEFSQTLEEVAGLEAREGIHAITITDALGEVAALADGPVDFLQPAARPPRRAPGAYPAMAPSAGGPSILVLSATEVRIVAVAMQGPAGPSADGIEYDWALAYAIAKL